MFLALRKKMFLLGVITVAFILSISHQVFADKYFCNIEVKTGCWYGGLGVGASNLDPEGTSNGFESEGSGDSGFAIYLGKKLPKRLHAELRYSSLGEVGFIDNNAAVNAPFSPTLSYEAISAFLGYYLSDSERRLQPFVKAGISSVKSTFEDDGNPIVLENENATQLSLGVGVEYALGKSPWFTRAEIDIYASNVYLLNVSIARNFGVSSKSTIAASESLAQNKSSKRVMQPLSRSILGSGKVECKKFNEVAKTISFENNTVQLSVSSRATLDDFILNLPVNNKVRFEIRVHTDSQGDSGANMRLSQDQADVIKGYLINGGLRSDQIVAQGYGGAVPIATNETLKGRLINKRVELKVLNKEVCEPDAI